MEMSAMMNQRDVAELDKSIEDLTTELKSVVEMYEMNVQQLNKHFKQMDQCMNKYSDLNKSYHDLLSEWEELRIQLINTASIPTATSSSIGNGVVSDNNNNNNNNQNNQNHHSHSMGNGIGNNNNGLYNNINDIDEHNKYEIILNNMKKSLDEIKQMFDALKNYQPNQSKFLISLMGNASIKLWNESDRMKFRTEYNRFKERMLWLYILFPLLQIWFHFSILIHQMHTLYLFYYYVSLAIRENILKQNGSRIEFWWIYHHYITLIVSLLFFVNLSPTHPAVITGGVYLVNYFMIWQGLVMALQMRYQAKRHYVRKTLAKKNKMDVRTTEVIDERPSGDFEFLIPALYATYLYQLLIAVFFSYLFISQNFSHSYERWQMGLLAFFWSILPIGNLSTLIKVLHRKRVTGASTNRITHAFNKFKRSLDLSFGRAKSKSKSG